MLRNLATTGKIATLYADITNPEVVKAITELPDFQTSQNVIYLSNIIDFMSGFGRNPDKIESFKSLKPFENAVKPPIFIDALLKQGLLLRSSNTLPEYTPEEIINFF